MNSKLLKSQTSKVSGTDNLFYFHKDFTDDNHDLISFEKASAETKLYKYLTSHSFFSNFEEAPNEKHYMFIFGKKEKDSEYFPLVMKLEEVRVPNSPVKKLNIKDFNGLPLKGAILEGSIPTLGYIQPLASKKWNFLVLYRFGFSLGQLEIFICKV